MILNASDISLSSLSGSIPNVSGALMDWFRTLTFTRISKAEDDYRVIETKTQVTAYGVRQPMTAQELFYKPEGQRSWKWETIHALPELILFVDDIVSFDGTPYRVIRKHDWKEYGYVQYDICQDFQEST